MSRKTEPSNFHALTPDVVINLVEAALAKPCSGLCRPLNSYINRVYELQLRDGVGIIAKFYRPGRWSEAALQDEHDFLLEMTGMEIPVIPPLTLTSNKTLGVHNGMFFAVFPKKGGRFYDEYNEDQWLELGRLLGRAHAVGAGRMPRDRITMTPAAATRDQVSFILEGGFIAPPFAQQYAAMTKSLIDMISPMFEELELIRIHGDCHFSNLIYRPDESFYLIDLDDMAIGAPVQDLWMLLPGYAKDSAMEINLFLEGYETFRPFDRRTLKLIEPLRAMRYIHYTAWCAHQATDCGFARLAPDFGTPEYWRREIQDLEEQLQRIETHC